CILTAIPTSACKTATNETCICNDADLAHNVQTCAMQKCMPEELMKLARIQDAACNRPRRSRRTQYYGLILFEIFTVLCLVLRIWSRWKTLHRYDIDDYIIVVALLYYIDESLYMFALSSCKMAILFFYLRIFPHHRFRISVYIAMVFVVIPTIAFIFISIFQCRPIRYLWEGWKGNFGEYHCIDISVIALTAGGIAIAQDTIILVLPLPLVVGLNASRRKRAGIIVMFSLGVFIVITSCIRMKYLINLGHTTNPTWDLVESSTWSGLEINVSMVVASVPAIRVYLIVTFPRIFGS
ncbi:uncharacterized protein BCR38DRAFT_316616, partial [Pseudomassariella vexata]